MITPIVPVRIPLELVQLIDEDVYLGRVESRSDAIRQALQKFYEARL